MNSPETRFRREGSKAIKQIDYKSMSQMSFRGQREASTVLLAIAYRAHVDLIFW